LKKNDLLHYAEYFEISGRSQMNKEKLGSELYRHISYAGYLENTLLAATQEELVIFRKLLEVPFSEKGIDITYGKLRYLTAMGAVFLFRQKNTIYMVIPEEIKESYRQIDQGSFEQTHHKINEIHQYILAMTNLYGAFSSKLLLGVYNQQNKNHKKMSFPECMDIIDRLAVRQQYFYIYCGHIISDYYELPEMEEELDQMLMERKGKPFYIPKKSELLKYADSLYEYETPEFDLLKNFVYTKLKLGQRKAQIFLDGIRYSCAIGKSIEMIVEDANMHGVVFEGMGQVNEFLQLVTELSNNSRLWVNGGHTPREMYEKYDKYDKPNLRPLP
ncbi:MAG TPA: hypothetical protein DD727_09465, partial [Clostridiales bacterium]|nr:hypothetical protein [Clostridiales bacterium]